METERLSCTIVQGQFALDSKSKTLHSVAVDCGGVSCSPASCNGFRRPGFLRRSTAESRRVLFRDIVGCECQRGPSEDDPSVYLVVYAYPRQRSSDSDVEACRSRVCLNLCFDKWNSYDDNLEEASLWRTALLCLIRKIDVDPMIGELDTQMRLFSRVNGTICQKTTSWSGKLRAGELAVWSNCWFFYGKFGVQISLKYDLGDLHCLYAVRIRSGKVYV